MAWVAPFNAAGSIQFVDGNKPLGNAMPVTGGFALSITSLPKGTHSLTAMFIPANEATYVPSTSGVSPLLLTSSSVPLMVRCLL